ncbi:uncharacterized protein [Narcine bancroftii]|uniref:uncharacterized protein isoform X2 n=1 Tax=Narcine bancroftii TaxID=1343680 RepID=UPI003831CC8D
MFSTASTTPSRKDDGQCGLVASSELVRWFEETQADGLRRGEGLPFWFHGLCSRGEAERLLAGRPVGSYLLRLSQSQGGLVLSYSGLERCRHFIVQQATSGHYLVLGDHTLHSSISDLLDYHRKFPILPFTECLTSPCYKRLERHYEEIDAVQGRTQLFQDSGGACSQMKGEEVTCPHSLDPRQVGAALDGGLVSEGRPTLGLSGERQRPDKRYEEIDTIRGQMQLCRDLEGVSAQTEGEEATRPLSQDPQQAGVPLDGDLESEGSPTLGASGGRQFAERHYEEIHEILSRKRSAQGVEDPQIETQMAGGSEDIRETQGGWEATFGIQSDSDYQEIGEAKRLAAESAEDLHSYQALASRPVPTPPREAYAVVNKARPHIYAEPSEGTESHTYAEPDQGSWGAWRRGPRRHDYIELDRKQARRANYYCPEPTRGSSVATGSDHKDRPLPEPRGSRRPTATSDPTAQPLPVGSCLRPIAPNTDPRARTLPVPEGSGMRPTSSTFDSTTRPLPLSEGSPRLTALTSNPTVRPLPVSEGSLPPTAPTSFLTVQPLPAPEGSFRATAPTSDPMAQIPPGPESTPRPNECSFPTYARPVRKRCGQSIPEPTAAIQLNDPVYGFLPCSSQPSPAPAPRAAGVKPQPSLCLPKPVPQPPVSKRSPGAGQGLQGGPSGPGCGQPESRPRVGLRAPGARPGAQASPLGRGLAQFHPAPVDPASQDPNLYESIVDYQHPVPACRTRRI